MNRVRRHGMRWLGALLMGPTVAAAHGAPVDGSRVIRVNLPGPGSLPFLPIELIPRLQIDRARGHRLQLRYFTSGVLAAEDMLKGNAGFAAHGFSILPHLRFSDRTAVAVAALSGRDTLLGMLVRSDLSRRIRRVEDLKGASIAASSGNAQTKTYLQMVGELVLSRHGVSPDDVRWVPMAQNWDSVRSVLNSKSADAVLSEEPFLSRAVESGLARVLFHFNDLTGDQRLPGDGHLRAVVSAPRARTDEAEREGRALVGMLDDTLAWMAKSTPEQVIDALGIADARGRSEFGRLLRRYPGLFPRGAGFDRPAIEATGALLVAMRHLNQASDVARLIDARWVAR